MTDQDLAKRAAEGDIVAMEQLVDTFYAPLQRYLWHACGSKEDAEDAAISTLLRAAGDISKFRGEGSLRAWVFRVGYREMVRIRRKHALSLAKHAGRMNTTPDDLYVIQAALQRLTLRHRRAFLLVEVEGFTVAEASAAIGVPQGTVKSRCYHARLQLRELLAPAYPEIANYAEPCPD